MVNPLMKNFILFLYVNLQIGTKAYKIYQIWRKSLLSSLAQKLFYLWWLLSSVWKCQWETQDYIQSKSSVRIKFRRTHLLTSEILWQQWGTSTMKSGTLDLGNRSQAQLPTPITALHNAIETSPLSTVYCVMLKHELLFLSAFPQQGVAYTWMAAMQEVRTTTSMTNTWDQMIPLFVAIKQQMSQHSLMQLGGQSWEQ